MKIIRLMIIGLVFILFGIIAVFLRILYNLFDTISSVFIFLLFVLGVVFVSLDYLKSKYNFISKYEKIIFVIGLILVVIFVILPSVQLVPILLSLGSPSPVISSTYFGPNWKYVGKVTGSGKIAALACEAFRLPCPSNPTFQAQKFTKDSQIAYVVINQLCEQNGISSNCKTSFAVIINNTIYCASQELSWESQCPQTIQ